MDIKNAPRKINLEMVNTYLAVQIGHTPNRSEVKQYYENPYIE